MTSARIVFHVGYPKTGTTTLQQTVLLRADGVNYVGYQGLKHRGLGSDVQLQSETFYQALLRGDREGAITEFGRVIAPHLAPNTVNVLADELLTNWLRTDPRRAPRVIASVVPDASILVTVRNQSDLLRSLYDFQPTVRTDDAHARYVPMAEWWRHHIDNFAHQLFFDEIIDGYADVFGEQRVTPIVYEGLFRGDGREVAKLATLLDLPHDFIVEALTTHRANTSAEHGWSRLRTRVAGAVNPPAAVYRALRPVRRAINRVYRPAKTELSAAQRAEAAEVFGPPNRRLASRWQLDLASHGYDGMASVTPQRLEPEARG